MKKIIVFILLIIQSNLFAQVNIVPMPAEIKMGQGDFILSEKTKIIFGKGADKHAAYLQQQLKDNYGLKIGSFLYNDQLPKQTQNAIQLFLRKDSIRKNAYQLDVFKTAVYLDSHNDTLLFEGLQTILQLIKTKNKQLSLPQISIKDYPRFSYRGMHLDVCRHFFSVAYIKKYIDYLAYYKFNTFHWHLTDDQGWRIEIKKYPLLTQVGGFRNGTIIGHYPGKGNDSLRYGGFYTQAQIKEVVQYAAKKYIEVIPEIEMPGHASAAIAAYPQLSCFPNENTEIEKTTPWAGSRTGKQVQQTWGVFNDVFAPTEYTFTFLQNVIDEVAQLFPSKYIHIGGDECPKENWKRSPFCKKLIMDEDLKEEHGLQSYFIQRIEKYVNSKGKKIIGWDEILEGGLAPNATVMSWRGTEGGITAAQDGHNVIMTPGSHCYFDHSQTENEDSVTFGSYLPLEKVYSYNPVPAALLASEEKYILGAQANVWTEYITNEQKLEYSIFPRVAALAEVLWSPKEKINYADFETRLPAVFNTCKKWKVHYSNAYYNIKASVLPAENFDGILWKLDSKIKMPITVNFNRADSVWIYTKPQSIPAGIFLATASCKTAAGIISLSQKFSINKATGKQITLTTPPDAAYPGNGAFTLVDGIQNEKGFAAASEFIGFNGKDMEAVIDLGKETAISEIRLHTLSSTSNWIYPPSQNIVVSISNDGIHYTYPEEEVKTIEPDANGVSKIWFSLSHAVIKTRYVKIKAENHGVIGAGNPGAGNPAWLFADEIEVL